MWVKLVIGAIAGLIIGHWVAPGYAVWAITGIILGGLVELVVRMQTKKQSGGR